MVQRTELDGMQQLGQAPSRAASVINRAIQPAIVDTGSTKRVEGILNSLSEFTTAASEQSFKQAQVAIEQRKIQGMSLAVSGGKLGEDATKAEQMGYDIVDSQSQLGKVNEELADYLRANPEVSDEDFNKIKSDKYGALLSQYQDRAPEVFKAISVKAQESQLALQKIKSQQYNEYRKNKGMETLSYNIGANLDMITSPEKGAEYIHNVMGQGHALGLSEFETKGQILDQMKLSASQGDARLLKAVSITDWGKYTQESKQAQGLYKQYVKQAQSEYDAAIQKQNVVYYAQGLADMETMAKAGATREQILAKANEMRSRGYQFSPSSLASYMTMGQTVSKSQQQLSDDVATWQKNSKDGSYNLATDPQLPNDAKGRVLNWAEDAIIQQGQNVPEGQRQEWITNQLVNFSKQQGMPIKSIATAISGLASLDASQPMTAGVTNWTKFLMTADDQTIKMNSGSDKDFAFASTLRDVLVANQDEPLDKIMPTAIARAQAIRDNKTPLAADQVKKVRQSADKVTKQLEDPTETTWYLSAAKLPSQTRDFISNSINADITRLAPLVGNIDRATEIATKEWKNKNIVLTGGVVGNAGPKQLAQYNPSMAKPGDTAEIVQKRTVSALDSQINDIIKNHSKEDGIDYQRDQVNITFSNDGSTYQVYVGGISTGETYATRGLSQRYNDDYFKSWSEEQDKQQLESQVQHSFRTSEEAATQVNYPRFR